MVRGRLRATGSSICLKHKFGSRYQVRTAITGGFAWFHLLDLANIFLHHGL
jgi:hypothetical protein